MLFRSAFEAVADISDDLGVLGRVRQLRREYLYFYHWEFLAERGVVESGAHDLMAPMPRPAAAVTGGKSRPRPAL